MTDNHRGHGVAEADQKQSQQQKGSQQDRGDGGQDQAKNLGAILRQLAETAGEKDGQRITVGDIISSFGSRAYGPLLLFPAIICLLPVVGAIPGLSITMAILVILFALQLMFSSSGVWVPKGIRNLSVKPGKLERGANNAMPYVKWFDWFLKPRLEFLGKPPFTYAVAVMCIALALTMFPLALVPMGVGPPAVTILILALGLTAHDGLFIIAGTVLTAVSGWATYYLLTRFWDLIQPWLAWLGLG